MGCVSSSVNQPPQDSDQTRNSMDEPVQKDPAPLQSASSYFAETTAEGSGKEKTGGTEICVKIPAHLAKAGTVLLSPLDLFCGGRAVPMVVFYRDTLDVEALLASLEQVLSEYQVLPYLSPTL